MFSMRLLLVCVAPYAVSGDVEYAFGGDICAAFNDDGSTSIGLKGDTTCTGKDDVPDEWVTMAVVDMAFVKGNKADYLTDRNLADRVHPVKADSNEGQPVVVGPTVSKETGAGFEYVKSEAGSLLGFLSLDSYGFSSTASYLVTSGEWNYNTNSFEVARKGAAPATLDDVCVVPLDGTACDDSAKITAMPGTYKFSLFGYVGGSNFIHYVNKLKFTHVRIRQIVKITMGDNPTVAFNDGTATPIADIDMGTTSITSVRISGVNSAVEVAFPVNYNIGTLDPEQKYAHAPVKTKDVTIYAGTKDANSFFLDYIFELSDGLEKEMGYCVYDPDVWVTRTSTSTASRSVLGVAILVVTCLARWL